MKKILAFLLALILTFGCLAGCEKKDTGNTATESVLTENPNGLSLEENGIVYESLAQKAVVKTALAYLARGTRVQYADTRLNVNSITPITYRWQTGVRTSPEEYTSQ